MVAIRSSFRESSSAGVRSVRSWIRTSWRRSLASPALFFFPNNRSKNPMLLPPRQPLNAIPEAAALMIEGHEGNRLTVQSFGNVAERLPGTTLRIERHRRAAVRTDDHVFVLGHNADQLDRQQ